MTTGASCSFFKQSKRHGELPQCAQKHVLAGLGVGTGGWTTPGPPTHSELRARHARARSRTHALALARRTTHAHALALPRRTHTHARTHSHTHTHRRSCARSTRSMTRNESGRNTARSGRQTPGHGLEGNLDVACQPWNSYATISFLITAFLPMTQQQGDHFACWLKGCQWGVFDHCLGGRRAARHYDAALATEPKGRKHVIAQTNKVPVH